MRIIWDDIKCAKQRDPSSHIDRATSCCDFATAFIFEAGACTPLQMVGRKKQRKEDSVQSDSTTWWSCLLDVAQRKIQIIFAVIQTVLSEA